MHKMRWMMLGLFIPLTASAADPNKLDDSMLLPIVICGVIVLGVVAIAAVCGQIEENAKSSRGRCNQNGSGGGSDAGGWGDGGGCGGGGDGGGCGGGGD
ncbi:hypothetical protein RBE51_19485 [Pseudomonas taiwanensis]|uniref:hypothetical protein n=1 Tax=Pseudomonas taiwanensis TaxID=470150 RepID=UPI0028DDE38B|nr:hypothetical protein [Pseudomonas taiwanensis]MDT8924974.1 hypothetical protein [Pseudomonas taiwanensis]